MFVIMQVLFIALFILGVVRSRGVARILLAIWVAISVLGTVLTVLAPGIVDRMGVQAYALIAGTVNLIGSALLGVALIIGRPGHRPLENQGYQAQLRYPTNPAYQPNPQVGYQGQPGPYGVPSAEQSAQSQPSVGELDPYGESPYGDSPYGR